MKSTMLFAIGTVVWASVGNSSVYAQELSVGKYSGRYVVTDGRGEHQVRIELSITSIESGTVKGTAKREGRYCRGDYLIEGGYKENQIVLMSNKGGPAGDCTTNFSLVSKGNKLTGTLEQYPVELSK